MAKVMSVRYHGRKSKRGIVPVREHMRTTKGKTMVLIKWTGSGWDKYLLNPAMGKPKKRGEVHYIATQYIGKL
jgi:hypothetical protein